MEWYSKNRSRIFLQHKISKHSTSCFLVMTLHKYTRRAQLWTANSIVSYEWVIISKYTNIPHFNSWNVFEYFDIEKLISAKFEKYFAKYNAIENIGNIYRVKFLLRCHVDKFHERFENFPLYSIIRELLNTFRNIIFRMISHLRISIFIQLNIHITFAILL